MSKKRTSSITESTHSDPKPRWFYDIIGAVTSHDVKLALKAWDANLLDQVKVDLTITKEYTELYDPVEHDRVGVHQDFTSAVALVTWVSAPGTTPRFTPVKFMVRPETINLYAQDMNPENGQWRPYLLFQSMYIDRGVVGVTREWNGYRTTTLHEGGWESDDDWYFMQPVNLVWNQEPKRKQMDLW
jgi:hypothetical protein